MKQPIVVQRALRKLGQDINAARRRRHIAAASMAERAGISRATLHKIEQGEGSVAMQHYAAVILILWRLAGKPSTNQLARKGSLF